MHGFAQFSPFMLNNVMGLLFTTCIDLYCRAQQWSCLSWFKETLDLARSIVDHCDFDMWLAVCKHQFMTLSTFRYEICFLCAYCLQRFSTWFSVHTVHFAFYHLRWYQCCVNQSRPACLGGGRIDKCVL
jgi:hypothetical protein